MPFGVTSAGWGMFANHDAGLTTWIGSRSAPQLQVAVDDDWFDVFVFVGDLRKVLGSYTELTGRPNVPPDWSFGFWQSKISNASAAETPEVAERMRAADLPFDVLHLDTHGSAETGSVTSSSIPSGSPTPPATWPPWLRWG